MNAHQMMEFHTGWPCLCHRCGSFMLRVCRTLCTASLSCFVVLNVSCTIAAGDISCHWDHGFSATDVAAPTCWYSSKALCATDDVMQRTGVYVYMHCDRTLARPQQNAQACTSILSKATHAVWLCYYDTCKSPIPRDKQPSLTARRGRGSTCQPSSTA